MTDIELLELAAKAEGRTLKYMTQHVEGRAPETFIACWNPLTDDGDALRLAVTLGLWIAIDTEDEMTVDVIKATRGQNGERPTCHTERFKYLQYGDAYAATRRAIVRAAAAIGEAK